MQTSTNTLNVNAPPVTLVKIRANFIDDDDREDRDEDDDGVHCAAAVPPACLKVTDTPHLSVSLKIGQSVSQSRQKSIVFLSKTRNFASPRASPGVKTFQSSKTLHTESQKTRSNEYVVLRNFR